MATSPSTILVRFRVLLQPVDENGNALDEGRLLRGDVIEVPISVSYGRPHDGPVMRREAVRDTQANETGPRGQATDPDFVPGYGTPADGALPRGRRFESGEAYAARLEAEDKTPHVESGPGHVPTPRDLPRRARG
jgi:hypothetical protein